MQLPRVTTGSPDLPGAFAWTACDAGEPGQSPGCAAWTKWIKVAGCSWLQSRLPRVSFWSRFGPLVVSLLFCCSLPGTSAVYIFGEPTLAVAPQMHGHSHTSHVPALLADSRDMEAEFGEITYII